MSAQAFPAVSTECPAELQFVGTSPNVLKLLQTVDRVSASDAPVLITGECGTGKEILAQRIHRRSHRGALPYVTVNCGAIAGSLEESELFGYVAGAFTGATRHKQGLFEAAHRGTVFLDEIGETSPGLQVKLLRVLQDGDYTPVGSARSRHCDVRVIAATNLDLSKAVETGSFRADLYYRLDVVRLWVPPLRERMADIPGLIRHFVAHYCHVYGLTPPEVHADYFAELLRHDYPGNVRELSNYVHRAVVLSDGTPLTADLLERGPADATATRQDTPRPARQALGDELPAAVVDAADPAAPAVADSFHDAKRRLVETFEHEYLIAVLTECHGIVSRAAARAGMSERGFHQKLKKYDIHGTTFRGGA